MKLKIPMKTRILLPLATFTMFVLFGPLIFSVLAFAPDANDQGHSTIYISECPGTVTEEGPFRQVVATVASTQKRRTHMVYELNMVDGTADRWDDFSYKAGLIVTSNPSQVKTIITNDDHLDDGETFIVTVGPRDEVGQNPDQRCTITIRDNDPPRVRQVRLVSKPADGDTYRAGEQIEIEVVFDNKVRIAGEPTMPLWITVPTYGNPWVPPEDPSGFKRAAYVRGSDTKVLRFAYEVGPGDRDSNGLMVPELGRNGLGKGTVKWSFGDRDANHFHNRMYPGHKVDGGALPQGSN